MYAFQIIHHLLIHGAEFLIDPNRSILICLFAFFSVGASTAVFAGIVFFLPTILVSLYRFPVSKMKRFPIWAHQLPLSICLKVYCSEWVIVIVFILCFFLVHREFHEIFPSIVQNSPYPTGAA